jgi:hypothetical protein
MIDKSTIQLCARLSLAAYSSSSEITRLYRDAICKDEPTTDTHLFIVRIGDVIYVTFRGTADFKNWLTDFSAIQISITPGVNIHHGFWCCYNSVVDWITATLARINPGQAFPVVFTGHSLGGALAVLAAWRQTFHPMVVTFGQPRVGSADFVEDFSGKVLCYVRVVNNVDVVPRVPFLLGRYRHGGEEMFYDVDGCEHDGVNFFTQAKLSIDGMLHEHHFRDIETPFRDHSMSRYLGDVLK